jgi:hypothetical protein
MAWAHSHGHETKRRRTREVKGCLLGWERGEEGQCCHSSRGRFARLAAILLQERKAHAAREVGEYGEEVSSVDKAGTKKDWKEKQRWQHWDTALGVELPWTS